MEKTQKFSIQTIFFFIVLLALGVGFFKSIAPFIIDIMMAFLLYSIFRKPFLFLNKKLKHKRLASLLTTILVIVTVALPITIIVLVLSKEISSNINLFQDLIPKIQSILDKEFLKEKTQGFFFEQQLQQFIESFNIQDKLAETATNLSNFIFTILQKTFISITSMVIHIFVILFLLYYIFIDGKNFTEKIFYLSPLDHDDETEFANELQKTTDAIIFNIFMIGIIEGIFGGIIFWIVGIEAPIFWAVVMAFLSMIPMVGANTIIFPASIIQLTIGNYWEGIFILIVGTGGILVDQNLIKPKIDSKRSGLHPTIVFLSSIGAMIWLGIIGFIVGPIISALFIVILNQYGKKFSPQLSHKSKG